MRLRKTMVNYIKIGTLEPKEAGFWFKTSIPGEQNETWNVLQWEFEAVSSVFIFIFQFKEANEKIVEKKLSRKWVSMVKVMC